MSTHDEYYRSPSGEDTSPRPPKLPENDGTRLKVTKENGRYSVQLDGTEIAHKIRDGGLSIVFPKYPFPPVAHVEFLLTQVDIDVPDAAVFRIDEEAA